jgi:hypothetical protein
VRRRWLWITVAAIILIVGFAAVPHYGHRPTPGNRTKALQEARQVGIAMKLYATDDSQGRLPDTLSALIPRYIPDTASHLIRHMVVTTPRARLNDLPSDYIIAVKLIPGDGDRLAVVRSDISAAIVSGNER